MLKAAVIGLGSFGKSVLNSLIDYGMEVIVIDEDRDKIEEIKNFIPICIQMDCTDREALLAHGINEVDVAVICAGDNFNSSVLITAVLKEIGVKKIVVRAKKEIEKTILQKIGADLVVIPEIDAGERLAYTLFFHNFSDVVYLGNGIIMAPLPASEEFAGKKLSELGLRQKYAINLIMIKPAEGKSGSKGYMPMPDMIINSKDVLIVAGKREDVLKFGKTCQS